jgi:hypothetical protein
MRLPLRLRARREIRLRGQNGVSVVSVKVTAKVARRFLVAHHLLAPARSLGGGPDAVLEVFRRFGSIQFDPLAVAGRNHDLVLHARVADYEPAWCGLLYERGDVFEAFNKGLALGSDGGVPVVPRAAERDRAAHPR